MEWGGGLRQNPFSDTLVLEVFLDFSLHERAAREPPSGEKERPLVTLDLNLPFMHMPAVE